jgi:hypothetical protein
VSQLTETPMRRGRFEAAAHDADLEDLGRRSLGNGMRSHENPRVTPVESGGALTRGGLGDVYRIHRTGDVHGSTWIAATALF